MDRTAPLLAFFGSQVAQRVVNLGQDGKHLASFGGIVLTFVIKYSGRDVAAEFSGN